MPDGGETVDGRRSPLPDAAVADLRADERRRRLLSHLADTDGAVPIADAARAVAESEASTDVTDEAVEAVRREIFQEHLPKLTATGVVRYDSLVGTVELDTDDERLVGEG
ncbi:MAG: hypothetical protein ABEJ26_11290 [Halosimplex sp.]